MSAPSEDTVTVNGFTVIQVKFKAENDACHCLYLKEHNVRVTTKTKPKDKTLFVLNVPSYVNEECLERLFSECGHVDKVFLQDKPAEDPPKEESSQFFSTVKHGKGFKVAYVVFKKNSSVQKAKKLSYKMERVLYDQETAPLMGVRKWCQQYEDQKPNLKLLQAEIDDFMAAYDKKIEEEKEAAKSQEGVPDEDGWVTVSRHGKNKGIPRTESQEKKITKREKNRRKDKELLNFYAFQIRETKRENLAQLREKFEEDKQRIQLLKANRKFKPY